ncbi:hypothetical protein FACS1894167_14840 [Synergistales bacterium]|nr:hypothetical protein FACS1894167_14840 [Synergistales bacterium]
MISVIIATLNRAEALRSVSLPSLLRQDRADFETIVWDASEGGESKRVCDELSPLFEKKGAPLRYFKAPRAGSSSQRNDAVREAAGGIVYFIDDDTEISIDTISALRSCFASFPWLMGASPPLLNKNPAAGNSFIKNLAVVLFGAKNMRFKRIISGSGALSLPVKDMAGSADWLSGCTMALRKSIFGALSFDERLERFGGYAIGEDVELSHKVALEYKQPLMVAHGGYAIHHSAPAGNRSAGWRKVAAAFYNHALIRKEFERYGRKFRLPARIWGHIGSVLSLLCTGTPPRDIIKGIREARKALRETTKQ